MKVMGHYRPASKAAGDDITLTRYIRTNRGGEHKPRRAQPRLPGLGLHFVEQGRTKFKAAVKQPDQLTNLLVSGHSNVKIGRDVRKGRFKGYWVYTLSLEERKTCPRSCDHWQDCYGNNMPLAKRIDHTAADFLSRLEAEIVKLCHTRRRTGVLVRLHALGDFYSELYVAFWDRMLEEHANLAVFGYTARAPGTDIGWAVHNMNIRRKGRCFIRISDGGFASMSTVSITSLEDRPAAAFVCPEQTGKTLCCATCGACWGTTKNVAFLAH